MAASAPKYSLGSPQEHIPTCEKHNLIIDIECEDCGEFICSKCAKTEHKDHDWNTITSAASLRRRQLKEYLCTIRETNVKEMDKKIQNAAKQTEANQIQCDSEVSKLQKHYDRIISKLNELKMSHEKTLRDNLRSNNFETSKEKVDLEMKKKQVLELVKFLEERHSTMSDFSLMDNLRNLASLTLIRDCNIQRGGHLLRYREGIINEGSLESLMGQTFDLDSIAVEVIEKKSFQYGYKPIYVLEAITEDTYIVGELASEYMYIERVNLRNKEREKLNLNVNGVCVAEKGDVYFTNERSKSIERLGTTGSVLTAFSTGPLIPEGICYSNEGGLLVTLRDSERDRYQLGPQNRRLVRHVTPNGDVIREYEYNADGRTRLFTVPYKVRQNFNTDICVVNWTSGDTSELVILTFSGALRSVYRGQDPTKICLLSDVVCDSHCNILVSDVTYSSIHLLGPDGEFMKFLLTEKEVQHPMSVVLYKSTLWVGDIDGRLSVFNYKS